MPTQERLLELFDYNPLTGCLTHKLKRRGVKLGSVAGGLDAYGYLRVKVGDGRFQRMNRVVYTMQHGPIPSGLVIDHIDRDKTNNRIENVRAITAHENVRNSRAWQSYCPNCLCNHCAALKGLPLAA